MNKLLTLLLFSIISLFSFAQSWQDVGGGTNNSSHGMLTWNGKLVNLGSFNNPCNRVATWDGTQWECLGGGVGIVARAGCVWNGNLVVVGDFWNNFQPCTGCNGVAMWDGTQWTGFDQGFNNDVLTCTVYNGDLIIGGDFTQANGVPINRVARWNETTQTFESMGAVTDMDNDVRCMTVYDGELWVGGDFNNVGGNPPSDGLVKWDESTQSWTGGNSGVDLVGGVNETVRVLYVNPNDGNLYLGGEFPELWDGDAAAEDFNMAGVAMYDGSNWFPLGTGLNEYCRAIHEYNGDLIVGGYFTTADGVACNKIARWNTTTQTFSPMGQGFDGVGIDEYVKSAEVWNGIFFAGGAYTQAEGGPMNYIAQWYEPTTSAPTAAFTPSSTAECEGSCLSFVDNSTNAPTSWTWSFPGANTTSSSDQNPTNICYSTAGTYTVSLQACNANGCNTTTVDITIETAPSISVNLASICEGQDTTLTATPSATGGTYLWSPTNETTQAITVSPASTTTYSVVYTLNGCSSAPENITVNVTPVPTLSVNQETICEGENVDLTATPSTGGGSFFWATTSETTGTINVSPITTTDYSVNYTIGGCGVSETTTVTVNPTYNETESISACQNSTVTYPDGTTETITSNTSHTSLLSTLSGCDSIIVTNVNMTTGYNNSETINACQNTSVTYPDGTTETITASTTHTSNLTSVDGCDSVIVTNVNMVSQFNTSENVTICENTNFTFPDGTSQVITGNTSHTSALQSSLGCDSVVVTNVTMAPVSSSSESIQVCENTSVTYPDGTTETITANTTHTSLLSSIWGCDSTVFTTVTVNPSYNNTESVGVCENTTIIYPDGTSETVTTNTSHTSMLSTVNGCDSIILTNVSVNPIYNVTETYDICSGSNYTYPDGTASANITANETHVSALSAVTGCDSVVTINLNVVNTIATTQNIPLCEGDNFTYPDGTSVTNLQTNETHISTLQSVFGCDSVITTNITVNPVPALTTNSETICEGEAAILNATPSITGGSYLWLPNMETTSSITVGPTATTNYTATYTLNGCESNQSVATVTVNPMPIVTVSESNNVITADQTGANYQWMDCNTWMNINGENGISYAPTANGEYAVIIDLNGCIDTSSCEIISTIGFNELSGQEIELYPNPAVDEIQIKGLENQSFSIEITDANGKVILIISETQTSSIDVSAFDKGVYFININEGALGTYRFVKQ